MGSHPRYQRNPRLTLPPLGWAMLFALHEEAGAFVGGDNSFGRIGEFHFRILLELIDDALVDLALRRRQLAIVADIEQPIENPALPVLPF